MVATDTYEILSRYFLSLSVDIAHLSMPLHPTSFKGSKDKKNLKNLFFY